MLRFDIITIFPGLFSSYLNTSIIGRAQKKKLIKIKVHNLRDFAIDKHKTVDDAPYGGGPGMVLKVEPIYRAVKSILEKQKSKNKKRKIILFSFRGKKFDQKMVRKFSKLDNLILICGHYEGVDERVAKYIADEEISIGDYILTGGEIPAMVVIDAVSRHIPGVLGKKGSLEEIKGSYPVYTRPAKFSPQKKIKKFSSEIWRVPKVLLSGNHKAIEKWREKYSKRKTI